MPIQRLTSVGSFGVSKQAGAFLRPGTGRRNKTSVLMVLGDTSIIANAMAEDAIDTIEDNMGIILSNEQRQVITQLAQAQADKVSDTLSDAYLEGYQEVASIAIQQMGLEEAE